MLLDQSKKDICAIMKKGKAMEQIYKKWWLWVIIILIIASVVSCSNGDGDINENDASDANIIETDATKSPQTEPFTPSVPLLDYIINTKSHKFHTTDCNHGPTKNIGYFTGTRDELIDMGYSPCSFCEP